MPNSPRAENSSTGALAAIVAAGLIWGTIPLVVRAADGASIVKVFFRVLFAGIAIAIWMTATGRLGELRTIGRHKLAQIAVQGAILALNWALFLTALDMTNVATAELLGYTGPVFVALFAPLVTGERFRAVVLVPLALALGGIVLILAPQGLGVAGSRQLLGAGLAFASAITYATLLLRSKKLLHGVSGGALMLVEYAVAGVLLAPFVLWAYAHGHGPSTPVSYAALLCLGLVQTAFAGVIFLHGLRQLRTDSAAILTYTEPASAVVFAALFLGEPLTWWTLGGGALVVLAGLVVSRLERPGTAEPFPLEAAGTEPF
jgi:drug/metabolite transporter (DMT)-like permease